MHGCYQSSNFSSLCDLFIFVFSLIRPTAYFEFLTTRSQQLPHFKKMNDSCVKLVFVEELKVTGEHKKPAAIKKEAKGDRAYHRRGKVNNSDLELDYNVMSRSILIYEACLL